MKIFGIKIGTSGQLIGIGLFLITLILRLPFRSRFLYHWDSVNFALSLENYDVRLHQPHPPGYFLYSMVGKLVNLILVDKNDSLVMISILSGIFSVLAIYWLGKLVFNRQVGLLASLFTITAPLNWFYNEVALSYSLEFLLVTIVAGLCYLQLNGSKRIWPWVAILFGIIGGVRQNDLVFLFPLWLYSLTVLRRKEQISSILLLIFTIICWALPMIILSGGISGYLAALSAETIGIARQSVFFSINEVILNWGRFVIYFVYGIILGGIPLIWGAWQFLKNFSLNTVNYRFWFFLLWICPASFFYIFIHIRQHGHIFTFLPAVYLLISISIIRLGQLLNKKFKLTKSVYALAICLLIPNILFFLFIPPALFGSNQLPLQTPSLSTISNRDKYLEQRISAIHEYFDPGDTVIIAGGLDFRHVDYYFPNYQETELSYNLSEDYRILPSYVFNLVLLNNQLITPLAGNIDWKYLYLPDGNKIAYINWENDQFVRINNNSVIIETNERN